MLLKNYSVIIRLLQTFVTEKNYNCEMNLHKRDNHRYQKLFSLQKNIPKFKFNLKSYRKNNFGMT
jgi:hypothetical protein